MYAPEDEIGSRAFRVVLGIFIPYKAQEKTCGEFGNYGRKTGIDQHHHGGI